MKMRPTAGDRLDNITTNDAGARAGAPRLRIVVLTHQYQLTELAGRAFCAAEFDARYATNVCSAISLLHEWHPHVAIVDLDSDGDRLLDDLAPARPGAATRVPTLVVKRHCDLKARLAIFDRGVDDVMTGPLSADELRARVLVIARRSSRKSVPLKSMVKVGGLRIDTLNQKAMIGLANVQLTGTEQRLLYFLAANAGQVVTHDQILDALWGVDYAPDSNVISRHVRTLRAKLHESWRDGHFIATVPGQGYRFEQVAPEHSRAS